MKGNQTMDRIEKLEMEVEGLRNVIKIWRRNLEWTLLNLTKMTK